MESSRTDHLCWAASGSSGGGIVSLNAGPYLVPAAGGRVCAVKRQVKAAGAAKATTDDGAVRVVPAIESAEGAPSLAPKRKRGRPKGSKNKPKITNDGEPTCKRGRPARNTASPKRSLVLAMGHAQDTVPPVMESSLASTESLSPPRVTSPTSAPVPDAVEGEASVPSLHAPPYYNQLHLRSHQLERSETVQPDHRSFRPCTLTH
ncbi:hypothetical protein PHYPSEUDO_012308 [Phytophthora pseudosyringae]|uniref:Uncharacterized protein n=1 Tax=Phytophthora pseudosyringae TaxID=221518 RepID=A0A8T1W3M0_9STRA|nr:hypothetical protein PHYPSEUDO_012308 [Phytophthora pseudosyringae]